MGRSAVAPVYDRRSFVLSSALIERRYSTQARGTFFSNATLNRSPSLVLSAPSLGRKWMTLRIRR